MITEDAKHLLSQVEEDLHYCENINFSYDELLMVHVEIEKLFEKYNISKKETTALNPYFDVDRQNEHDINEFLTDLATQGSKPPTCKQYDTGIHTFLKWYDNKNLREATEEDIKAYLRYRMDEVGIKPSTAEQNRSILFSFYSFLHSKEYIRVNPMIMIPLIKFKHAVRVPLSKTELEMVREACKNNRERALVEVLYSTGARANELSNIHVCDVNLANRTVFIREPKGFKQRTVLLSEKAVYYIREYWKEREQKGTSDFLISNIACVNGVMGQLSKPGIEYMVKNIGERAGINRRLFPHLFRHTMATHALNGGMGIDEVGGLLGHANINNTRIYAKRNVTTSNYKALVCK